MNVRPISVSECNIQAFQGKKNKSKNPKKDNNIVPKALILAGALSAATISGILLIKHKKFPQSLSEHVKNLKETLQSKYENKMFELNIKKAADSLNKPNTSLSIQVLPSGVKKIEEVSSDSLCGTNILTQLTPSVNGVAKIQTHKFVNGDISEITTFDKLGKQLKNILFEHDYIKSRKPHTITITDSSKGITKIFYEFSQKNPNQVSTVIIEKPDGSQKITKIKEKLFDKLSRAFLEIGKSIY